MWTTIPKIPRSNNGLANQKKFEKRLTFRNSPVKKLITPPIKNKMARIPAAIPMYLNNKCNFIAVYLLVRLPNL